MTVAVSSLGGVVERPNGGGRIDDVVHQAGGIGEARREKQILK